MRVPATGIVIWLTPERWALFQSDAVKCFPPSRVGNHDVVSFLQPGHHLDGVHRADAEFHRCSGDGFPVGLQAEDIQAAVFLAVDGFSHVEDVLQSCDLDQAVHAQFRSGARGKLADQFDFDGHPIILDGRIHATDPAADHSVACVNFNRLPVNDIPCLGLGNLQDGLQPARICDHGHGRADRNPLTHVQAVAGRPQLLQYSGNTGPDHKCSLTFLLFCKPVAGDDSFQTTSKSDQPDYQIIEKLAEGGMGAIYIARQTSLDRELAIKTLKPLRKHEIKTYTSQGRISQVQKQRREMFLSEALVTANLVHPHIIPIHDLCQTVDEAPFYSMKRVNGTPWNCCTRSATPWLTRTTMVS